MLITNWLSALVSRIRRRPRYNSRARRTIRRRLQAVQQNRLITVDQLEDRTLLTAQVIDLAGTTDDDNFVVNLNSDGVTVEVWNDSTLLFSDLLSNVSELNIDGDSGTDTLTIDLSNGLPLPLGNISFDGEADGGTIILEQGSYAGTISAVTHSLSSDTVGSISIDGQIIGYSGIGSLTDSLTAANRIFDFLGAAETITVSDDGIAGDGLSLIDSNLGSAIAYVGSGAVTIQTTSGSAADAINVTGLDSLNASDLTIIGGSDDNVTFQTNTTEMGVNDLTVTAQTITIDSAISSTDGAISLTASRNIVLNNGSSLTTVDGGITLLANDGGATAGEFIGIQTTNTTIQTTGSGDISLTGLGGSGTGNNKTGVYIDYGTISSTATGADAGTISLNGAGGSGDSLNRGVVLYQADVASANGDISITGVGGGTYASDETQNHGVNLHESTIASTGTGANAARITIDGTSGVGLNSNVASYLYQSDITSIDGAISLTGTGANTVGSSNYGIIFQGGTVESSGTGTITVDGTGGAGDGYNFGTILTGSVLMTSVEGAISITGQGGGNGSGDGNIGTQLEGASQVVSTGTGANAATINITGTAGDSNYLGFGVKLTTDTVVSSVVGDITLQGTAGDGAGDLNIGLDINGADITSSGAGTDAAQITLIGTGGAGTNSAKGINLENATVASIDGDIALTGQGGAASGDSNIGVNIYNSTVTTTGEGANAGSIDIDGTGGTGNDWKYGVNVSDPLAEVSTVDGSITITTPDDFILSFGAEIRSITGDISITADTGAGNNNKYFLMTGDTFINAGSGSVSLLNDSNLYLTGIFTSGLVTATSTAGSILDNGDIYPEIVAGTAILNAYDYVGTSGNFLEAHVVNLSGTGTNGGFYVSNSIYKRIIDDGDTGFSLSGSGWNTEVFPDHYGGDNNYLQSGVHSGDSASWQFDNLVPGLYRISGYWYPHPNRATNTQVTVTGIEGGSDSQVINQQNLSASLSDVGKNWQDIGFYQVDENGTITVTFNNDNADGLVVADAMRIEKYNIVSVGDVTVDEDAGTATFTVTSHAPVGGAFSIDYTTADGTAVAGSDYTATSGTLNFTGTSAYESQTVSVNLNNDTDPEAAEYFYLNLSNIQTSGLANFIISAPQGLGTINASDSITLNGTSAADDFLLKLNADGITLELWNDSTLVYEGLLDDYTEVNINGGAGADTLTVDLSNGLPFPHGNINFDGEADGGSIVLNPGSYTGAISAVTHSFSSDMFGSINVDGQLINYTNAGSLTDNLTATNRVFDFLGAAETITVSDDGTAGDGISLIDSTLGAAVTYAGAGAVTVKTISGSGSDSINVEGLDSLNTSDLTITGDSDDDVTFQNNSIAMGTADLSVTAHTITVDSGISSTSGAIALTASRNIVLNDGSSLTTVDGGITLSANAAETTAGDFIGIETDNATIQTTGSGDISLTGHGGAGTGESNAGVYVGYGTISSTGTGVNAGTITLDGSGGAGTNKNRGLVVHQADITSVDGDMTFTGVGGGSYTLDEHENHGVNLEWATIASTGTGTNAAQITIDGTSGAGLNSNVASYIFLSDITSVDGAISLSGTSENTVGSSNYGIIFQGGTVESSGIGTEAATITVDGTGGTGDGYNFGTILTGGALMTCVDGAISITGQGGGNGSGDGNIGTQLEGASQVISTGTGANAATINITGTAGNSNHLGFGVKLTTDTIVSSVDGDITLQGTAGDGSGDLNTGLDINGADITSSGAGTDAAQITLIGTGGAGTNSAKGINLENATVTSIDGDLSLTGQGGAASGDSNIGVNIYNSTVATTGVGANAGSIDIDGTGGTGNNWKYGVNVTDPLSEVSTVDGSITIATPDDFILSFGAEIRSITGDISITADTGAGNNNKYFLMTDTAVINAGSGSIHLFNDSHMYITGVFTSGLLTIISSSASIQDSGDVNPDIVAGSTSFYAPVSVGTSGNPLETHVVNLSGNDSGGGFYVNNSIYKRIIDDGDTGFSLSGSGWNTEVFPDHFGGDNNYLQSGVHSGDSASWKFDNLVPGLYRISGYWYPHPNRATNTQVTVTGIQGGSDSQVINQQNLSASLSDVGKNWQDIGFYQVDENGVITVTFNNDNADGLVVADAMRIERYNAVSVSDVIVDEDAGTAIISVTATSVVGTAFSVDFATIDGTAFAGSDYTSVSGTLNFSGTVQNEVHTITIPLTEDEIVEADETMLVNLSVGSQAVELSQSQVTVTIADNDSATLSIEDVSINESDGIAIFSVVLNQAVQGGLQIDWSTADGTAIDASDYTADSGTLTFAGTADERQTITITLTDDSSVELTESLLVTLSNLEAVNGVTLTRNEASAFIHNDDSLVINEDAPEQTINLTGIVGSLTGVQVQFVAATSDDHSLVSDPVVSYVPGDTSGTLTFTPNPNQHGTALITITLTDELNVESTHTFMLVVTSVNDAPTVAAQVESIIDEDYSSYSLNLLSGASDVDTSDVLGVSGLTLISGDASGITDNGTSLGIDPSAYQSLADGESEVITFNYNVIDGNGGVVAQTAVITISGVNDAPTASSANVEAIEDGATVAIDVLAADVDSDDDVSSLVYAVTSEPSEGTVVSEGNGIFTFDPGTDFQDLAAGQTRVVSFTFTVTDSHGAMNSNGTVMVTVTGVNDAPTLDSIADPAPINEDAGQQTVNLTGITAGGGENQVLTITVSSDNPALIADPAVTYTSGDATGSLSYTPGANQNGTATITVTVTDEQGAEFYHSFTVEVSPVNDAPVAEDDSITAYEDTVALTSLFADHGAGVDSDVDSSDVIQVSEVIGIEGNVGYEIALESGALVKVNSDGSFYYNPNGKFESLAAGETATDSFTYTIDDGHGATDTAKVTVTVHGVNDAPVANDVSGIATTDVATVNGLFSASDIDDDPGMLTYTLISQPSAGSVTNNHDGTFTFDPGTDFNDLVTGETRTVTFDYQAIDAQSANSNTGTVTVTVTGSNAMLSISDASINEDAGTATFYVTVNRRVGQVFSIDYTTADSTATVADGDYIANTGTLVFFGDSSDSTGAETHAITVLVNNDQLAEGLEIFQVNLSGLSLISPTLILSDDQGEATINDDDTAAFSINDVTVNEADSTAKFTVSLNKDVDSMVSVDWATADDSATSSFDYESSFGTLYFDENSEREQTVTITLLHDTDVESLEQFVVNLTNSQSSGQSVTISDAQGVASIIDDDSASLSINDITVNEGSGTATFTVTLNGQVGEDVTVHWATADNTASEINDYLAAEGMLTFNGDDGETKTITVDIQADEFLEDAESFYVNLSDAYAANRNVVIADTQGEATISASAEEFSINDVALLEGSGTGTKTMTFTVTRTGADLTQQATIDFRTLTDPADLGGNDFVAVSTPVTLTFAAADPGVTLQTQTVTVTINNDDAVESDEEFTAQIENASSGTIAKAQGTGTIVNNDQASLTFTGTVIAPGNAPLVYAENSLYAYVVVTLDKDVEGGLKVKWSTDDIDALKNIDYISDSGTLTFAGTAGETEIIEIQLVNDPYVEPHDTFAVDFYDLEIADTQLDEKTRQQLLSNVSMPDQRAVVEIFNDDNSDNPSISVFKPQTVIEGQTSYAQFKVILSQDVFNGASFSYTTVDGTAVAGSDYEATSGTISFQGNANEQFIISVPILNDSITELDETFFLHLSQLTGASLPIDLSDAYAKIVRNDITTASVSIDDVTVSEDDVVSVTVSLSQATIVDLSMLVNTGDGADTAGNTDYFGLSDYKLVIPAGETSITFDLPLYRDLLVEEDETFTINLSELKANGASATGWASFSDVTAVVTISDVETTGLDISNVVVDENAGTATFKVSLATVADTDVTFDASTVADTATGGVDYTEFTSQPYTISAGDTSVDITVSILDDSLFEGSEAFTLALSNILVGGVVDDRLTVLNSSASATINDNEAASITIADLTVNEDATNAVLTVTVDEIVGYAFSVDWATQGVTAHGESDYTTSSGTLNFTGLSANETQQITIPITDDDIVEWDELFLVNLSNVSASGANVTIADDQAEVTITGSNDIAQLSIGDLTALEHNQFGFEITLDKAATKDITVLVSTTDGTADSSDYTALTDYLVTIAAGETSAFVYVDVTDDTLIESSETFTVSLSGELIDGATDATRVGIADGSATGTISDNDFSDPTTTANAVDDYYFVKVEDLGTTFELDVLNNDTRTGTTTITSITAATGGGTAAVGQTAGDDVVIFTPNEYASGTITFNYTFEDSALNTGTGQVTIVIVDAYGIYGDFKNDRYEADIETPELGKVPEYISQEGFADDYFTKFDSPSLIDDTETVDTTDTVIYQNAMGTGGSFSITTDIDSTLTRDYTDLGGGSWEYLETLVSSYSITTSFSETIGVSEYNTINLVQSGTHNYQYHLGYTPAGTSNATTTWYLSKDASDHYEIDADFTIEEPGEDEFTMVITTTQLDSTHNYGNQTLNLSASETVEDDGQGGEIMIAREHDLTLYQYDEYEQMVIATATVGQDTVLLGTAVVSTNTDGVNHWTRTSNRDYDYNASSDEYSNTEGFSYSSSGYDNYLSVESTNIAGTITKTEDVTVAEETTDANGTVTPAIVLSTTITTVNDFDIDSSDFTHDEFQFFLEGNKEFNNLGTNSIDTELTTYSYSDSGYSDYSLDEYYEVDLNKVNSYGTDRIYNLDDNIEHSHSEYTTQTSNTSRLGNTSGSAHSEYNASGWSDYIRYAETIFENSDESNPDILDKYTSTQTSDTDGSSSYRDVEILDEQIVNSHLEGTSTYLSSSRGVDHHSLASREYSSVVNTEAPESSLSITSLTESTDQGTTNWKSSYSNKGNYQIYDAVVSISAPGIISQSYNLGNYADISNGDRTTTYHTLETFDYSKGNTLTSSSSDEYVETNRFYEFLDTSSGSSEYSTVDESNDATGEDRDSTYTSEQDDQYSYKEFNGNLSYYIDQSSSQMVDTDIDGISTEMTGMDTYYESGTKFWDVNDGGISNYTETSLSTSSNGGDNWTSDEDDASSETTSHVWTEYLESGNSTFETHSSLDLTTIDESVDGIKNTVTVTNQYDESSSTVTPEEGVDPISNNSFSIFQRTDDYLKADGTTSSSIDSKSDYRSASIYEQTDTSSFELIISSDPAVTSEQRGTFSNELSNGERTSHSVAAEQTTTTGTQLPEGTPDSGNSDILASVYDQDEMHYVKTGQISNQVMSTDRSEFAISESASTIDIVVQYVGQSSPDSVSLISELLGRFNPSNHRETIAPAAITGGFGGSGGDFTFGDGLTVPPGSTSQSGGAFYRISTFNSSSEDSGNQSQKSLDTLNITFRGETGVETDLLKEITDVQNLTGHNLTYETFVTSQSTPVPDGSSGAYALPLSSFQSAYSIYSEGISSEPEDSHSTTTFISLSSSEDVDGNVELKTVNRIAANTNLNWVLNDYTETGSGNYGTNSESHSNGKSSYDGVHEEVVTSITDPNQAGEYLTMTIVTENFVTHSEDYANNDLRFGASNQLSSGWKIDLHFVEMREKKEDTEVEVVITTDTNDVTTEVGTRHTFRDTIKDHSSYALQVSGSFGGSSDLSGDFNMSADGGSTSIGTEDITMTDGEITDRAITELLTTSNGYHFSMTAEGNGFNFSTTAGGANFLEQNKWGNLNYEVIDGVRTSESNYSNRVEIVGLYTSTSSGGTHDTTHYRLTRFFDLLGNTSDFIMNRYNRADQTFNDSYDGETGETGHYEAQNETHVVNTNDLDQETAGPGQDLRVTGDVYQTTTDSQGNINVDQQLIDDSESSTLDNNWADDFAAFVPTLPFFDPLSVASSMMSYVGGGSWNVEGLGFLNNGETQTAPEPTGEPVDTGTEPDGTYWEQYDNGIYWLYREYASEGGELIKEEWGYYSQTFFDILQDLNQLIEEAAENVGLDKIDEFFADLTEVGESLSQTNNIPPAAENEIEGIASLQEEHLPDPYIYATSRPIGVYNADAPWHDIIHSEKSRSLQIRQMMVEYHIYQHYTIVNGLKKQIAALEANRITPIPVGLGDTFVDTIGPKTPEQIELEKQLAIAEKEAQRIRDVLGITEPITHWPLDEVPLEDMFVMLIELAWKEGYFGDSLNEELQALKNPETYKTLAKGLAAFIAAYAAAHASGVTWAVDGLVVVGTGGEAAQVLADVYGIYLEIEDVSREPEMNAAAKKLAAKIIEASESGILGLLIHYGGKKLPRGKNTEVPPTTTKDYDPVRPTKSDVRLPILNHDTCFIAGTPILTPDGDQNIETFKPGDPILSRPENAPDYPVKVSTVEEVFELASRIVELKVAGQIIGTTEEHPFYIAGRGWVQAEELEAGDQLVGHNDELSTVESVTLTGRYETVYNLRVKQDRTYFVGKQSWGFSVWVHNTYHVVRDGEGGYKIIDGVGKLIREGLTEKEAKKLAQNFNDDLSLLNQITDPGTIPKAQGGPLQEITLKESASPLYEPSTFDHWEINNGIFVNKGKPLHFPGGRSQEKLDFVVGLDGKLYLGHRHAHLARQSGNANKVQAAGTLTIKNGVVVSVDNSSGHFLPSLSETLNYRKILESVGIRFDSRSFITIYGLNNKGEVFELLSKKILEI